MEPFLDEQQMGQLKAAAGIFSAFAGAVGGITASLGLALLFNGGQIGSTAPSDGG